MRRLALYLLGFCLGFYGCRHNVAPNPGDVIERSGYSYFWVNAREADVLVWNPAELQKAIQELCAGNPCAVEEVGTVYRVIRLQP